MDIERTDPQQDRQRVAEDMKQVRSFVIDTARLQSDQVKNHNELLEVVRTMAEVQRQAEQENRAAHRSYEETHREMDERFNALIRMMDEWIRERRRGNGGASPAA